MSDALLFSRDCIHIIFYTLYSSIALTIGNSTQHINSVIREIWKKINLHFIEFVKHPIVSSWHKILLFEICRHNIVTIFYKNAFTQCIGKSHLFHIYALKYLDIQIFRNRIMHSGTFIHQTNRICNKSGVVKLIYGPNLFVIDW